MDEITILTVGDVHISDVNPRSRIDDFKASIFEKLNQIKSAAKKLKADAVLFTGDLYNIKSPAKNSHELNRELIEFFKSLNCPVYSIPGNHDLTSNDLDTLHLQPLSVLYASGSLKNLKYETIKKNNLIVSMIGVPYTENLDLKTIQIPPRNGTQVQLCLMHIYASPKGGKLFKEKLYGYEELSVLGPDIFVLGHYHVNQHIQSINGKHFINLGSISRGTIAEENIYHKPSMGLIKITLENSLVEISTVEIPLKIKPAEEVFDLKKKEEEQKETIEIQKFVDKLISETADQSKRQNVENLIENLSLSKIIKETVISLINEATINKKLSGAKK
jgi:DNA repair exonuclease SbcCD nuclease subunit